MLGQYLRYMGPALETGPFPKVLLEDRFLDHFSQSVASTGLPPVYPALTNAEIKKRNDEHSGLSRIGALPAPTWPYSPSGSALLGR